MPSVPEPPRGTDPTQAEWMRRVVDAIRVMPTMSVISTSDGPVASGHTGDFGDIAVDVGVGKIFQQQSRSEITRGWAEIGASSGGGSTTTVASESTFSILRIWDAPLTVSVADVADSEGSPTGSSHNHDDSYSTLGHAHDGRYYTQAQSDASYAPSSHSHNDLYYTKALSDASYAASSHTHDASEISNLPSSSLSTHALSGSFHTGTLDHSQLPSGNGVWDLGNSATTLEVIGDVRVSRFGIDGGRFSEDLYVFPAKLAVGNEYTRSNSILDVGNAVIEDYRDGVFGTILSSDFSAVAGLVRFGNLQWCKIRSTGGLSICNYNVADAIPGDGTISRVYAGASEAQLRSTGTVTVLAGAVGSAQLYAEGRADNLISIYGLRSDDLSGGTASAGTVATCFLDAPKDVGSTLNATLFLDTPTGTNAKVIGTIVGASLTTTGVWTDAPCYSYLKEEVGEILPARALSAVNALRPIMYRRKMGAEGLGPEQAGFNIDEMPEGIHELMRDGVSATALATFAIGAVKELSMQVKSLEAKLEALA